MPESACDLLGIDDIEDLIGQDTITPKERYENKSNIVPRVRKKKEKKIDKIEKQIEDDNQDSLVLGRKIHPNIFFFYCSSILGISSPLKICS